MILRFGRDYRGVGKREVDERVGWIHLLQERPGSCLSTALADRRATLDGQPPVHPHAPNVTVRELAYGDCTCLELLPNDIQRTLVYFHGGGYRVGSARGWLNYGTQLADRLSARVLLPDYRLAPEHPFPAAINDAIRVWDAQGDAEHPIFLGGDSAGGGLAAVLATLISRQKIHQASGLILISPWLDLTNSAPSFDTRSAVDLYFSLASAREASSTYLQGHDPADPLASPLFGEIHAYPPSLIMAGGNETLADDAKRFVQHLVDAGKTVQAFFAEGMQHVWPITHADLAETKTAFNLMRCFVNIVR